MIMPSVSPSYGMEVGAGTKGVGISVGFSTVGTGVVLGSTTSVGSVTAAAVSVAVKAGSIVAKSSGKAVAVNSGVAVSSTSARGVSVNSDVAVGSSMVGLGVGDKYSFPNTIMEALLVSERASSKLTRSTPSILLSASTYWMAPIQPSSN